MCAELLPRLVLKELVDNALDVAGEVSFGRAAGAGHFGGGVCGFWVANPGAALPGTPAEIAALFSIGRQQSSSKLLRLPTRGALGNGLRVVAGAVLSTGGVLRVETGGRALRLTPRDDGTTAVEELGASAIEGTRVEVVLGAPFGGGSGDHDRELFAWATRAQLLAGGSSYPGDSSAHWYDADAFFELCRAAPGVSVRELLMQLEGLKNGGKAGKVAEGFARRDATSIERAEAAALLASARSATRAIKPERLGYVGAIEGLPRGYARGAGIFSPACARGDAAAVPFVVEAWVEPAEGDKPTAAVYVNRTPTTGAVVAHQHEKTKLVIRGAGLHRTFDVGRRALAVHLNVIAPFVPITTDGKEPDLKPMSAEIGRVIEQAARKSRRCQVAVPGRAGEDSSKKSVIVAALAGAIDEASGGGAYRYSLRQLFYAVRPKVLEAFDGAELDYGYFGQVVTDHEAQLGHDLAGVYRDERGVLLHPHTGERIPLGTKAVEAYARPRWRFNKVLYIEKGGFFEALLAARWPERHDCALLTSQGFASRAARDVLDLLGESDEPITLFAIHDADGPGTAIYEALQGATSARARRKVEVINLGLEPAEALEMKLQVETPKRSKRAVPVAKYVEPRWRRWLQKHRVELNAMSTPVFLGWLDRKMAEHEQGKLVPPAPVLREQLLADVQGALRRELTAAILRDGQLDLRVEEAARAAGTSIVAGGERIEDAVARALGVKVDAPWTEPVRALAETIAKATLAEP